MIRRTAPLRLPAPVVTDTPLGSLIRRGTAALGIRQCSGCQRREQALNRILVLRPIDWGRRRETRP